ncbi:hypothetical protein [Deltalipothrixvirus pozzuoliense]|uniref:Uncharacterized protein ORF554 n=1 Tax=Acidianus filamentous virus 2 (isolate Italy/Pozzuoli) TaxID=654910 RepID=Y554_AFV2P|nr:hypothetical protein AFV2_gp34 [Acidianus filamentous virus 2]Q573D5.1 RecName: Full=Uncharacterized protein ORF554 [Acidianus filamentous virus 2 (isolate Pozzuoli)]CAH69421.1 hypothetical protein [Acidianus filamentous virus 2]
MVFLNNCDFYFVLDFYFSHTFLSSLRVYKISMSFITGIEKDITNFFSGASDTFSGVVNFGSNIVNGVQNAVQGVVHSIANIAQGIYNGILSIGSDIVNIFGQIGGAIWHGLVSFATAFGTFFYEAFHIVSSAVYGAFQRVASAFEYVGKWIWGGITHIGDALSAFGNWLYNGFREIGIDLLNLGVTASFIYADIKSFFITIWNGLVVIGEDIANAFKAFASSVESLFNTASSYASNLLNDVMYIPEDASKYVASKVSSVLPRVASYNLFFEEMKSLDRLSETMGWRKTIAPILLKIGSPFIAGFTSLIAETALKSFFPEVTGVSPRARRTVAPPPSSDVVSSLSVPNPFQNSISQFTPPTVSPPPQSSVSLSPSPTFEKYVVGAREEDEELLVELPTVLNKLASPYPNSAIVLDEFTVGGYIVQTTREFISFSSVNNVYVIPYATLKIRKVSEESSATVDFTGGVLVETYLLGIPICPASANNASTSSISGAINDGVNSSVQVCLEIGNVASDSGNFSATAYQGVVAPVIPAISQSSSDNQNVSLSVYQSTSMP